MTVRLIPRSISRDTVEALDAASAKAKKGEVMGVILGIMYSNLTVELANTGEFLENPLFARCINAEMDDYLAESPISGWPGKTRVPSLNIRCKENKTEMYINTGMTPNIEYGSDEVTVTLRFDKTKAVKYATGKSTDGEALFFHQSIGLIKKMMNHSEMLFEFIPFNSSPAMTSFNLRGMSDAVKPIRAACKW